MELLTLVDFTITQTCQFKIESPDCLIDPHQFSINIALLQSHELR